MAKKKQMIQEKDEYNYITGLIPVLLLFMIGLIKSDSMSLHQKVFKTVLILAAAVIMTLYYTYINRKEKKVTLHFAASFFFFYFLFFFIQYVVSFFSGEISYDREYYIANYGFLLIFSLFTYLFLKKEEDIISMLKVIPIFLIILFGIGSYDFYEYASIPQRIGEKTFENVVIKNISLSDAENIKKIYVKSGNAYTKRYNLSAEDSSYLRGQLSKSGFYKTLNFSAVLSGFRPALSFGNTNYMAAYLIGILPLAFISVLILYDRKKSFMQNKAAIFAGFGAILGIFPLILSQTTSAFLGLSLSVIFIIIPALILTTSRLKLNVKIALICAEVAVFVLIPAYILFVEPEILNPVLPRVVKKMSAPAFAVNDRINGWTPALELFKKHPITGAGFGTIYAASFKYISRYFYLYSESNSFKHAHNEFVEVLGEGGILGITMFFILIGYIFYKMMSIFLNKSFSKCVRFTALGVLTGIFSILIQQIFDLSLRMSVTMASYFFLIGVAVFLISYTDGITGRIEGKTISINKNIFIFAIIALLVAGVFLFRPLFMCEHSIMLSYRKYDKREFYLDKAVEYMKGNPYAWNSRYTYHSNVLRNLVNKYRSDSANRDSIADDIEVYYNKAVNDVVTQNSIIPDYQDVWSKHASIMFDYNDYLDMKRSYSGDQTIGEQMSNNTMVILNDINKSLSKNFLNYNNHLLKLSLLKEIGNNDGVAPTMKDAFETSILIAYSKNRRIVKENVVITFTDDIDSASFNGDKYFFNVSNKTISALADKFIAAKDTGIDFIDIAMKQELRRIYGMIK